MFSDFSSKLFRHDNFVFGIWLFRSASVSIVCGIQTQIIAAQQSAYFIILVFKLTVFRQLSSHALYNILFIVYCL